MDKGTKTARIDWRGADLRGANLTGMDLSGVDFRAADLRGVNFSGSMLQYADFRAAQVQAQISKTQTFTGQRCKALKQSKPIFAVRICDTRTWVAPTCKVP